MQGYPLGEEYAFSLSSLAPFLNLTEEIIKTDILKLWTRDLQHVAKRIITLMEFLVKYKTTINVSGFVDHFVIR